jgi:uncharacterized protein (DUF111 family)
MPFFLKAIPELLPIFGQNLDQFRTTKGPKMGQNKVLSTGDFMPENPENTVLVLRPNSGISGDIWVAGLYKLLDASQDDLDEAVLNLGFAELKGKLRVVPRTIGAITGWGLELDLPHEHVHRKLSDIEAIFERATIPEKAKESAIKAFKILAEAEGKVHGINPSDVEFHEVGALDSILDTGLASIFHERLSPKYTISGPLPICDGTIKCAHGLLASPAPAVSILLTGATVKGIDSSGETVTPTALALYKAFDVRFGIWPEMTIVSQALVYGTRVLPNVPNGTQFACGSLIALN